MVCATDEQGKWHHLVAKIGITGKTKIIKNTSIKLLNDGLNKPNFQHVMVENAKINKPHRC